MWIYSVNSPEFKPYGRVLPGYDTGALQEAMNRIPMPQQGVSYQAGIPALEQQEIFQQLRDRAFGGMPIQLGMCWGRNTKLNCLEYHRDSEINIGTGDFILLLAKQDEIDHGKLHTDRVKAFLVPAGTVVEVYATTLHYAPCHTKEADGFRVAVVLPRGTNTEPPLLASPQGEERWMTARNKWLLAHPDSDAARSRAYIGLTGTNIEIG